jgi:hypothetical protein
MTASGGTTATNIRTPDILPATFIASRGNSVDVDATMTR